MMEKMNGKRSAVMVKEIKGRCAVFSGSPIMKLPKKKKIRG